MDELNDHRQKCMTIDNLSCRPGTKLFVETCIKDIHKERIRAVHAFVLKYLEVPVVNFIEENIELFSLSRLFSRTCRRKHLQ
jgi:hypothetical protein